MQNEASYNVKIMERCPILYEYAQFIAEIRNNLQNGLELRDAIEQAINNCVLKGILADILRGHKAEVTDMILTISGKNSPSS